jgi:HK97 family phage major capsid protein
MKLTPALLAEIARNPAPFDRIADYAMPATIQKAAASPGRWQPPARTKSMSPAEIRETILATLGNLRAEGKITEQQYADQKHALDLAYGESATAATQLSQSTATKSMSTNFLQQFGQLARGTKDAFDGIESARPRGEEQEIAFAYHKAFAAAAAERKMCCGDPVARILQDPERAEAFEFIGKVLCTDPRSSRKILESADTKMVEKVFSPGITPSDDFGGGMFLAAQVSTDVLYASYEYSAWRDLGWRILAGARMKYAKITQPGQAVFITPANQGKVNLTSDQFISGDNVAELANTIALLFDISLELIQDGKTVLSEAVLTALAQGHGKAIDYASFQGSGADDAQNGTQTGIFQDDNIVSVAAAAGNVAIANLQRDDFIGAVAGVAAAALTRDPRWYISPVFLPKLLKLRDGQGPKYLLKTPAETKGEWSLVGFPVTWAAMAPAKDLPGQKVAAFGAPDGYLVALQGEMEVMASDHSKFDCFTRQLRGLNRGRVETREKTWLSTLKLAAQ